MSTLVTLAHFRPANYLQPGTAAHAAHKNATHAVSCWNNSPNEAGELRLLADVIHAQAVRCADDGGMTDYSRSVIVSDLLASFVALLNYDTGGWDGGTCDAWARSVAEYIGQPMG